MRKFKVGNKTDLKEINMASLIQTILLDQMQLYKVTSSTQNLFLQPSIILWNILPQPCTQDKRMKNTFLISDKQATSQGTKRPTSNRSEFTGPIINFTGKYLFSVS